ncbi:unnamed protein product, partial [Dibothriocephalus latus]
IAAQYDGIDLSSKKQYINEVIKEVSSCSYFIWQHTHLFLPCLIHSRHTIIVVPRT